MTTETTVQSAVTDTATRPPLKLDLAYALITLGNTVLWSLLSGWLLYFYLPPEGEGPALVPVALYSGAIFAVRIANALLAPPIGYLSDNTRTRWGRRLPFMLASGLPMAIFFFLIWTPPLAGTSIWNLVYLTVVLLLYNLAYTFNQIPYTALLPELARTDAHRVRISAWMAGFMLLGMILGGIGGMLIEDLGYAPSMGIYAGAALLLLYLPLLVLRERPGAYVAEARVGFRDAFRAIFRNRAFLVLSATGFFYWTTTTFVQSAVPYIATEICRLDKGDTAYFYLSAVLAALLCYPLITWLAHRYNKWLVFTGSLLASAIVLPGLALIGPWIPLPLAVQGVLWITLQAVALSAVVMLPPAFGAEVTDYDAELTGLRREGSYYATWGLFDQLINGAAAALLPLLLLLGDSYADPQGPLGVRMVGVVGGAMMFLAFLIFLRYPLRPAHPFAKGAGNEA